MFLRKLGLILCLLIPLQCISNDTLKITNQEIRVANQIFNEHAFMSKQIPELEYQIDKYKQLDSVWQHTDSLRQIQYSDLQKRYNVSKKVSKHTTRLSIILSILFVWSLLAR